MTSSKEQLTFDYFIKVIPLLTIGFLFISYIIIDGYYRRFGIGISSYLDISEFILIFLPVLKFFSATLLVLFSAFFPFAYLLKLFKKKRFGRAIGGVFLAVLTFLAFILSGYCKHNYTLTAVAAILFFLLFFYYEGRWKNSKWAPFIVLLISFGPLNSFMNEKYFSTLRGKGSKVSFEYNKTSVACNDSLIYVGQTKNYLFLYDMSKEQSQVYPFSDIKNFTISHKTE